MREWLSDVKAMLLGAAFITRYGFSIGEEDPEEKLCNWREPCKSKAWRTGRMLQLRNSVDKAFRGRE